LILTKNGLGHYTLGDFFTQAHLVIPPFGTVHHRDGVAQIGERQNNVNFKRDRFYDLKNIFSPNASAEKSASLIQNTAEFYKKWITTFF
jgi:hypothetical protein